MRIEDQLDARKNMYKKRKISRPRGNRNLRQGSLMIQVVNGGLPRFIRMVFNFKSFSNEVRGVMRG